MHPDWYAEDAQDRARVWSACHRCGKRTTADDVHTCTPPAIVGELESQLAGADEAIRQWSLKAMDAAKRAERAEAQLAQSREGQRAGAEELAKVRCGDEL